jgi:hypothetical protein
MALLWGSGRRPSSKTIHIRASLTLEAPRAYVPARIRGSETNGNRLSIFSQLGRVFGFAARVLGERMESRARLLTALVAGVALISLGAVAWAQNEELPRIDQQISDLERVYRGTEAAMEDASCFQSFFIFGRGVVRTPRCQSMNNRLEDSRRQLRQLQDQRDAIASGRGNRREISDLQNALSRNGCAGAQNANRGGGGLFDWFGGNNNDNAPQGGPPISTSIVPNTPYRTVCVRLCDGFYYPISYSVYSSSFGRDAAQCQQSCAAPAQLYVYQNPGQEMEQAISLDGQPYVDLPIAFKYRKDYIKGCSCKQAEYNPTEIEAANTKKADAGAAGANAKKGGGQASASAQKTRGANDSANGMMMPAQPLSPGASEAQAILNGNGGSSVNKSAPAN